MADADEEVVTAKLVEQLKAVGFTEYEARTLVVLTQLGTATASDIADADDVPRTRVYDAVETLHERGLVDVQYTTPQKFTVVSQESVVRKLTVDRENLIARIGELLDRLDPKEPRTEEAGVWTVTGGDAVAQRVLEFVDEADQRLVYMTVDELLTDEHVDHLRDAAERDVKIHLAGVSEEVQERIRVAVPTAEPFETLWEWSETPAGSLLVVDDRAALVSVRVGRTDGGTVEETAIWGDGERNSLVVVLRAIFTWRLEELPSGEG